jgi:hypothetical protein
VILGSLALVVWGSTLVRNVPMPSKIGSTWSRTWLKASGTSPSGSKSISRDELGELARWFNIFLDNIHQIIFQVTAAAEKVAIASEELNTTSQQITANSEKPQSRPTWFPVPRAGRRGGATARDVQATENLRGKVQNQH